MLFGEPAEVVTVFTPASARISRIFGLAGFIIIRFAPKGLSVNALTSPTRRFASSGLLNPRASIPKAPASQMAAIIFGLFSAAIGP